MIGSIFVIAMLFSFAMFIQDKLAHSHSGKAEQVAKLLDLEDEFVASYKTAYDPDAAYTQEVYFGKAKRATENLYRQLTAEFCERYAPSNLAKARKILKSNKSGDIDQILPGLADVIRIVSSEVINEIQVSLEKLATQSPKEAKARRRRRR